ncbi:conjugative transfer signal peptidase TraF (plasmid) [Mesorhizobium mediterraneum]|uniref:Conjugative transfer signal peptidase TraF n=1 Tax=Mesorhizobium mediterraneum TaxID=43617 RepID=A0AB36RIP0_9HYPH|nr:MULTISPECIES: conjugative transfer signal peptidase TraF [Mesorhizobium]PAQ04308.1 conjugative transfer signal peptidase TraF [Mesorhizobium mediterraneum]RUU73420.1 conjugative transfer signal peptidase TraF [Mesorhizobium sp. M7A.F.Ca.MR.362.00.0.0]RUU84181.1 conjugative transfer signal peptidase TraF [Mesorhizobium sp. M7A.F.Ca.MR.176.00.0.0]RWA99548.1 MAG: conjugative transfer signal peptidase TraF [Mesorhizobium sp.]RWB10373.1 MAG: conjugative transfer signal peptidase TraF [Mesorhizob
MTGRGVTVFLAATGSVVGALAVIGFIGGFRLNLTPSEPLGIWRIETLHRPAIVGDLVFICPPAEAQFEKARQRGYLRRGVCAGGFAPLIKSVAALPGQRVDIDKDVEIDGEVLGSSRVRKTDGEGRAVDPYPGGTVPPGHLYLHSSFASSYDSRYFGPVPDSGLLGLARPVVSFDP